MSLLLFHFYARIKLLFRSVLYRFLSNDFQNIICFIHFISGGIQSKCNEASTLLEVIQNRSVEFREQIKNLYRLQRSVCIPLEIGYISLRAVSFACGKALSDLVLRNIPNIEQSSKALSFMYGCPETTVSATLSFTSTKNATAPVVAKQAGSGIGKKSSLRIIGTAAVGIVILMDIVKIVQNTKALEQGKRSELVTRLEDTANEMETELKDDIQRYDPIVGVDNPIVGYTPCSENTLMKVR